MAVIVFSLLFSFPVFKIVSELLHQVLETVQSGNGVERAVEPLDPKTKKAYVYRPGQPVEELAGFDRSLSGEEVCPGFELDLLKLLD